MGVTDKYHRLWGISCNNTHIIQLVSNTLQTGWGWQTNTTDSGVSPATTHTSYSLSATHYKQDGGDRQIPQTLGYLLQQHTHHTACQQHTTNRMGVTDKYHRLWGISCNNTHIIQLVSNTLQTGWGWQTNTTDSGVSPATTHHTACQQHITNRMGVTDKYHRLWGISCNNTSYSLSATHYKQDGGDIQIPQTLGYLLQQHIIQLVSNTLQTGWGWQTNTTDSGVSPATHTSYSLSATHYKQDGGDRQIPQTLGYLLQQHIIQLVSNTLQTGWGWQTNTTDSGVSPATTHHIACQQHITNRMGVTDKYQTLGYLLQQHIIQLVSNTLQTGWGWQTNTTDSGVSPATTHTSYSLSATHYKQDGGDREIPHSGVSPATTHHIACQQHITNRMGVTDKYHRLWGISCNNTSYSLSATHYKQDGGDRQIPQTLGYLLQHTHHTACQQHTTNRMGVTDKYHRLWGISCNNTHIIQLVSNTLQTGWGWQTNTTDSGVSPATTHHTACQQHITNRMGVTDKYHRLWGISCNNTHIIQLVSNTLQTGWGWQTNTTDSGVSPATTHHTACQQHITNRMGVTDKYQRLWGISCNNTHIIQLVSNTLQTGWGWQTNTTDSGVSPATTHTSYSLSATHYKQDGGDRQIPQTLG